MNLRHNQTSSPVRGARALHGEPGFVFLDSSLSQPSSRSLLASRPSLVLEGTDWGRLEGELAKRQGGSLAEGAAIGTVAFDGAYHFGFYDRISVFHHGTGQWDNPPPASGPACGEGENGGSFGGPAPRMASGIGLRPGMRREDFLEMVRRAKDYIAAGDIYQVCLAHAFEAAAPAGAAWEYFKRLRRISPAPYSAYMDLGGRQVVSASPECFLRMDGRRILTRPIKGTRPRRRDPEQDFCSEQELVTSAKERAELVMITDLERSDLGQVCEFGSVRVSELLLLERFEQVFHLVSTVEGRLRGEVSHVRALRECFPGGSISGAPKKRALEIIRELEPCARGLYTGAIGYFSFSGESQFSVAIRTAVFQDGRAHFHVGAGIVADSIAGEEWQETLDKAAGLLAAGSESGGSGGSGGSGQALLPGD